MAERILFLTGHLARARLEKVLAGAGLGFEWSILDIGVKVAALMTEAIIARRLPRPVNADRVIVPGRCRADLARLSSELGVAFDRGPDELKDLPAWFGKRGHALDLSRHDMRIFAEIVDASALSVGAIVARARAMCAAGAQPVLIPEPHGDLPSLLRAAEAADKRGIAAMLDPILDPIHFDFMASLARYAEARRRLPDAEILMGTGNLTELTDADSVGTTAMLLGICSELHIRNLLVVQVSPHTRRTIQEHDAARRIMFAAREEGSVPKDFGTALLALHERKPFPYVPAEIAELAAQVKDDNFRIEIAEDGIHIYNRHGHHVSQDAFSLFAKLGVERDGAHAF